MKMMLTVVLLLLLTATTSSAAHSHKRRRILRPSSPLPSFASGICNDPIIADQVFCNASQSLHDRVHAFVDTLSNDELIGLLVNNASAIERLRFPAYAWWNEALHGVAISPGIQFTSPTSFATSFPQVISLASSFNKTLFHAVGDAIASEARAFFHVNHAGLTYWTPNINIFRDPRWGRGQETPGEDPYLNSQYAIEFVRGLQSNEKFLKVSAACKHFSSYSQEIPRHERNAMVTRQDQEDTYWPAFQACVTTANASGLMCSYNAVNGIPSCADHELLDGLIRKQWGFDGYIVSDCGAVQDIMTNHHYTQSPEHTCATVLAAGMDLNCGEFLSMYLPRALEAGIVTKPMLQTAMRRLVRVQMRLGLFEKGEMPYSHLTPETALDTPAHQALALEAAIQSIVLLKNDDQTLPLRNPKDLGLVGPHLNASDVFLGNYQGIPRRISTPLQALQARTRDLQYAFGCQVNDSSPPDFAKAEHVAMAASQLIVFVGLDPTQEREGLDRDHLRLPGYQEQLIERMVTIASQPLILVIVAGGSVLLEQYKHDPRIGAIIFAGYLGQAGGEAIAQILYGEANPSGRLTQTFYGHTFTELVSLYDMRMRPDTTHHTGHPGRTYRFYTGDVVYAFGHGLSYTTFEYTIVSHMEHIVIKPDDLEDQHKCRLQFHVQVRNTGTVAGQETVLVFSMPPSQAVQSQDQAPTQSLVAFEKTPLLQPHEQTTVRICLLARAFAIANRDGQWTLPQGLWHIRINEKSKIAVELTKSVHENQDIVALE